MLYLIKTYPSGMFKESEYKQNLSRWDVSNVKNITEIFTRYNLKKPYWAEFNDLINRMKTVENYRLREKLETSFSLNSTTSIKTKI